jgi:hypothetical protein
VARNYRSLMMIGTSCGIKLPALTLQALAVARPVPVLASDTQIGRAERAHVAVGDVAHCGQMRRAFGVGAGDRRLRAQDHLQPLSNKTSDCAKKRTATPALTFGALAVDQRVEAVANGARGGRVGSARGAVGGRAGHCGFATGGAARGVGLKRCGAVLAAEGARSNDHQPSTTK